MIPIFMQINDLINCNANATPENTYLVTVDIYYYLGKQKKERDLLIKKKLLIPIDTGLQTYNLKGLGRYI